MNLIFNPWMRVPFILVLTSTASIAQTVYVSRMWHNHQPIYWPEWNMNGGQTNRVECAWDSIVLKSGGRSYPGSTAQHPEKNLPDIFGVDERKNSHQSGPVHSDDVLSYRQDVDPTETKRFFRVVLVS